MDSCRKNQRKHADSGDTLVTFETVRSATSEERVARAHHDEPRGCQVEKIAKISPSRIALVCDWLTTPGGAEKVLLELHKMYPDAPIYTSQYSKNGIDWFDNATVKTGWLQIFPKSLRKILGPLRQLYFSHLDLSAYDLVISVTGAEAKAIKTQSLQKSSGKNLHKLKKRNEPELIETKSTSLNPEKHSIFPLYHTSSEKSIGHSRSAYHLCYCHVPTQYYWQMYDKYVDNPGFGFLNPLVRFFFKLLVKPLRKADYRAAQQPDQFITISNYAQQQIQQYYDREAVIIAPPVDIVKFLPPLENPPETFQNSQPDNGATLRSRNATQFPADAQPPADVQSNSERARNIQPQGGTSLRGHAQPQPNSSFSLKNAAKTSWSDPAFSTKKPTKSTAFPQSQARFSTKDLQKSTAIAQKSTKLADFSTESPPENHTFSQKSSIYSRKTANFPQNSTIYPQDVRGLSTTFPQQNSSFPQKYFIIACRQVTWKRVDLAIQACLQAKLPLLVVGDGPEHAHLQKLAGDSRLIRFAPWVQSAELAQYLQGARGYLFPSLEPFGIAAVEALAAGCPVIAYAEGGSRDFIQEGKNGLLFSEQTVDSLAKALKKFSHYQFDRAKISPTAQDFNASVFRRKIQKLVDQNMSDTQRSQRSHRPQDQSPAYLSDSLQKPPQDSSHIQSQVHPDTKTQSSPRANPKRSLQTKPENNHHKSKKGTKS